MYDNFSLSQLGTFTNESTDLVLELNERWNVEDGSGRLLLKRSVNQRVERQIGLRVSAGQ